jgi:antitoxin VapB
MALNIKNAETERLARELARRRGTGTTEAITHALRKEIERERRRPQRKDVEERLRRIRQIVRRFNARPLLDDRSDDEILGYNEQGLFD